MIICSSLEQLLCDFSISFGLLGADCATPLSVVSHISMPTKRSWATYSLAVLLMATGSLEISVVPDHDFGHIV